MMSIAAFTKGFEGYKEKFITIGKMEFVIPEYTPIIRNVKDFLRAEAKKEKAWYSKIIAPKNYGERNGMKIAENTVGRYLFGVPGTQGAVRIKFEELPQQEIGMSRFAVTISIPASAPIEAFAMLKKILDKHKKVVLTIEEIEKMKSEYVEKYQKTWNKDKQIKVS